MADIELIDKIETIIDSCALFRLSAEAKAIGGLLEELRRATSSVSEGEMPELPHVEWPAMSSDKHPYTADQMRDYGKACIRAATKAAAPDDAPKWGRVDTVGDLVRNLLTLDQGEPISTAFHVTIDGERRCKTRPVWISRERVIDGKWIDSSRKDVPYAHVIWAKPDERAPAEDAREEVQDAEGAAFLAWVRTHRKSWIQQWRREFPHAPRRASSAPAIPGWKLVPIEPTDKMRAAVRHQAYCDLIDEDWAAMLAAAPSHPSEAKAGEDA